MNNIPKYSVALLLLLALQFALFNNIVIGMGIIVFVYIYFILILPIKTPGWAMLLIGFITGLAVDSVFNTGGIHAFATVFISFLRMSVLKTVIQTFDFEAISKPGIQSMGFMNFSKYALSMAFVHNLLIYFIELFHFKMFFHSILVVIINTLITAFICILLDAVFKKEKSRN
jgi:rod shape-determining protein MreD